MTDRDDGDIPVTAIPSLRAVTEFARMNEQIKRELGMTGLAAVAEKAARDAERMREAATQAVLATEPARSLIAVAEASGAQLARDLESVQRSVQWMLRSRGLEELRRSSASILTLTNTIQEEIRLATSMARLPNLAEEMTIPRVEQLGAELSFGTGMEVSTTNLADAVAQLSPPLYEGLAAAESEEDKLQVFVRWWCGLPPLIQLAIAFFLQWVTIGLAAEYMREYGMLPGLETDRGDAS